MLILHIILALKSIYLYIHQYIYSHIHIFHMNICEHSHIFPTNLCTDLLLFYIDIWIYTINISLLHTHIILYGYNAWLSIMTWSPQLAIPRHLRLTMPILAQWHIHTIIGAKSPLWAVAEPSRPRDYYVHTILLEKTIIA